MSGPPGSLLFPTSSGATSHGTRARQGELRFPGEGGSYRPWFPPGWPFFLALSYRLFGEHADLVKAINLVLSALVVYLTLRIGKFVFGSLAGLVAGVFAGLLPGQIVYVSLAQYEVFLTALVLHVGAPRGDPMAQGHLAQPPAARNGATAGVGNTDPAAPCLAARRGDLAHGALPGPRPPALGARRDSGRLRSGRDAGLGGRNAIVLGEPVFFSTHGGYNAWLAHRPGATGGVGTVPDGADPQLNLAALRDECAIQREGYREAAKYILHYPKRFVTLIPARIFHLYATDTTGLYLSFLHAPLARPSILEGLRSSPLAEQITFRSYAAVMALALVGLLAADWRSRHVRVMGAFIAYWTAAAAVTLRTDRFHVPVMPLFCAFAGHALDRLSRCSR